MINRAQLYAPLVAVSVTSSALIAAFVSGLVASPTPAWSASIEHIDVERRRGRYELVANAYLNAPPHAIYEVLTDYEDDHFNRISSVYKESDFLEPDSDGTPIVYTLMEGCLMFYCLSMKRVERLEVEAPHWIRTVTLPDLSDFKYSTSEWTLEPEADGTLMTYRLEMEPDFFVPPVIGPMYLKRTLSRGGVRAVNRIERLARQLSNDHGGDAQATTASATAPGSASATTSRSASATASRSASAMAPGSASATAPHSASASVPRPTSSPLR